MSFRFQFGPNSIKQINCAAWEPWDSQDTTVLGAREDNVDPLTLDRAPIAHQPMNTMLVR